MSCEHRLKARRVWNFCKRLNFELAFRISDEQSLMLMRSESNSNMNSGTGDSDSIGKKPTYRPYDDTEDIKKARISSASSQVNRGTWKRL